MPDSATAKSTEQETAVERLFAVGAHYAYARSRRHPSIRRFIFGAKNNIEIFDLEKTHGALEAAKDLARSLGASGKTMLFVGGKNEARDVVRAAAERLLLPYVAGRWIGGTLSNFKQIRSRVEKLISLRDAKEKGELGKYTKMERLLIDRDIERLERDFGGLVSLTDLPAVLFVVDPRAERIAVSEAGTCGIPVIGLANSDCDISGIAFPIPGNDANIKSVTFFVHEIANAYAEGSKARPNEEHT